jgi:hypothetical protein
MMVRMNQRTYYRDWVLIIDRTPPHQGSACRIRPPLHKPIKTAGSDRERVSQNLKDRIDAIEDGRAGPRS